VGTGAVADTGVPAPVVPDPVPPLSCLGVVGDVV
jgi:hypothetical protein